MSQLGLHPINTILYATDMGDHMRPVFRFAINIAKDSDAKIIMLHVIEPLNSGVLVTIDVYMPKFNAKEVLKDGMKKALAKMQTRLNNFCQDEQTNNPSDRGLVSKVKVVSGRSAESIVHQAEQMGADLIVVGTNTSSSISSNLLGSTARNVTQLSKIPVLVVPVYE
ncbi:MAG: universal stress protein [gamma proteobacterium symbiont of Bathyaustriella thionipta]|nr:universal stress protein [gamma proteobacterium symbiont of Bathyaustriella thionipta]MCU7951643.1 universal stress protein [gamma proteobacterium symbiont of Bathyaustriella thionipta]MCU7953221.1 universal stress protein [gamma proteobacterium symbiont of Bathyaustriella thionipta]MCU7958243.1 universal stress protein [gamma proteobacterium symbiont of Bathyaustriella thionipta]MCU7966332.1 universal stress protein [gamma proteobacterium symbiont of Bathyaustriella thionipta]